MIIKCLNVVGVVIAVILTCGGELVAQDTAGNEDFPPVVVGKPIVDTVSKKRTGYHYETAKIENNSDFSDCRFSGIITAGGKSISHVKFDGSFFYGCVFFDAVFEKCSFRNCTFFECRLQRADHRGERVVHDGFFECDFTGADIQMRRHIFPEFYLPFSNFRQTKTYHDRNWSGFRTDNLSEFQQFNESAMNYKGKILQDTCVPIGNNKSNYEDALIDGAFLYNKVFSDSSGMTKEQLYATRSYKDRKIRGVLFGSGDFSSADLSKRDWSGTEFGYRANGQSQVLLHNADFTDAVITDCCFIRSAGLTLAQIKQTWNYKTGNMTGIKLPPEIQKALDEEKANK